MRIGKFGGFDALLIRGLEVTVADVIHYRAREEVRILKNDTQGVTKIGLLDLIDVDVIVTDLAVRDVIEAVDEVRDRCLTCTGRTYKGDLLARLGVERYIEEYLLLTVVTEVDIEETDIALYLGIGQRTILMRMLPCPDIRGRPVGFFSVMCTLERKRFLFRHFGQFVTGLFAVDKGDISIVRLRFFIKELEDTVGTGHRHDDGIHLLGYLGYRHDEGLRQLQEGSDNTERDDVRKSALDRQETADKGHENIKHVTDVAHDRHQDIGEDIRGSRILAEFLILLVKGDLRTVFVGEYLNDLLAVDHLFDITVDVTQGSLLLHEEGGTLSADLTHQEDHGEGSQEYDDRQLPGSVDHRGKRRNDRDARGHHRREALRDHLTERINVVGVVAHDITMRVRVEVGDRQRLHVFEHIVTDISQNVIGDHEHDLALEEVRDNAKHEEYGDGADPVRKAREVLVSACKKRLDIVVDQVFDEHVSQNRCDRCHDDAEENDAQKYLVFACQVGKESLDQAFGDRIFLKVLPIHRTCSSRRRHYSSPPFFCDSYTSL